MSTRKRLKKSGKKGAANENDVEFLGTEKDWVSFLK
jgi:hypothetical protein